LISHRKKLNKIDRKLVLGFLYHGFKPDKFFWEFAIIYRKVLIITIIAFEAHLNAMV